MEIWLTGNSPHFNAATAQPDLVWVCSTHCASSRAPWMALWMTKPAGLTGYGDGSTAWPFRSIFTRLDAVISSNINPYGLIRK
ncbi:hypothetical protein D3C76_1557670 [compost metagenome]